MRAKVRITVLKRKLNQDLIRRYTELNDWVACERLRDGKEFVSEDVNMPFQFCSWAWADIQKYVMVLARGGNFVGVKTGLFITCCTDGFRPVSFELERIPGEED